MLAITDEDQTAVSITYTLTAAPANGTLYNNGAALNTTTNKTFTQADINSGKITYTHNGSETTTDSLGGLMKMLTLLQGVGLGFSWIKASNHCLRSVRILEYTKLLRTEICFSEMDNSCWVFIFPFQRN